MGEEDDFPGIHARAFEDGAENFHNALCHSARIGMRGQHGEAADHIVGCVVDEDGLGKSAAHVDADAIGAPRYGWFGQRHGPII